MIRLSPFVPPPRPVRLGAEPADSAFAAGVAVGLVAASVMFALAQALS